MARGKSEGFTLIELLIVVAIIGIIASIAIPGLLNAVDRGKQKRTMSDLRVLGNAVETYSIDENTYPVAGTINELATQLSPDYLPKAILTDGWRNQLSISSTQTQYTVCSGGKDGGVCTGDGAGPTHLFTDSITYTAGNFVQWPEGKQR